LVAVTSTGGVILSVAFGLYYISSANVQFI
jgi:hypothetical protein